MTVNSDGYHGWPLDKTYTIATDEILCLRNDLCYNEVERNELTEINKLDAPEEIFTLHGSTPPKKPDGNLRLIYKKVNGLDSKLADNKKADRAKEIYDELEVDIVAYNKHQLNMRHPQNVNGFN